MRRRARCGRPAHDERVADHAFPPQAFGILRKTIKQCAILDRHHADPVPVRAGRAYDFAH